MFSCCYTDENRKNTRSIFHRNYLVCFPRLRLISIDYMFGYGIHVCMTRLTSSVPGTKENIQGGRTFSGVAVAFVLGGTFLGRLVEGANFDRRDAACRPCCQIQKCFPKHIVAYMSHLLQGGVFFVTCTRRYFENDTLIPYKYFKDFFQF